MILSNVKSRYTVKIKKEIEIIHALLLNTNILVVVNRKKKKWKSIYTRVI